MADHNELGKWGEQLAVDYLAARGYVIAERNWRMGHLEVDIIAYKDARVIFVEVKTRENDLGDPLDAVDKKRIRHLVNAANVYVQANRVPHEVQFDVIAIIGNPLGALEPRIEHIPDAFLPPLRTIR